MEQVLIRAEIIGENAAGQKHIRLLANNADGIHFWTDDKSIVRSIEPQRKKGKWIYNSPVTMKCDQCGFVIKDWDWHRFKFCPNCDCDMRGEQE